MDVSKVKSGPFVLRALYRIGVDLSIFPEVYGLWTCLPVSLHFLKGHRAQLPGVPLLRPLPPESFRSHLESKMASCYASPPSGNSKKIEETLPNNENQHYFEKPDLDHGCHPPLTVCVNTLPSF